jgi:predicted nucleic acid-binding Zn finger protein
MSETSYVCGVFTSWNKIRDGNSLTLHFAVNRFVGKNLVHYDLPSNNNNKQCKKRVSIYINLDLTKDSTDTCFKFVDSRFDDLIYKNSEYTLELGFCTNEHNLITRNKDGKQVDCYYFPMLADSIINISSGGTYLWTEDSNNTKKIVDILEAIDIISNNIVRVPSHIRSRVNAVVI